MGFYTVHEPQGVSDPTVRADRTVLIRERFSLAGLVFGPAYLLWHRLWTALGIYAAVMVAAGLAGWALKLDPGVFLPLVLVAQLFIGMEGRDLRRWALERRGYPMTAVVAGLSRLEAETAFFRQSAEKSERPLAVANPHRTSASSRAVPAVIGMFDHGDAP